MDPWPNFTYYPYCMVKEPYRCGPHTLDLCDGCSTIRALTFERDRYKAGLEKRREAMGDPWTVEKTRIWQAAMKSLGMPPAESALDSLIQHHCDAVALLTELEDAMMNMALVSPDQKRADFFLGKVGGLLYRKSPNPKSEKQP